MEVIFLKDHLNWSKGDKIKTDEKIGKYWIHCGVVSEFKEVKKKKQ